MGAQGSLLYRYGDEPYRSEANAAGRKKSTAGRGWYWASLGFGCLYFIGSATFMSAIEDDCNPIFITDFFKTPEQCKEDADAQRLVAETGMEIGDGFPRTILSGPFQIGNPEKPKIFLPVYPDRY